jgi:hypothetical protein
MSKEIPRTIELDENHPTMIKLNQLMDLADDLGLKLYLHGQSLVVQDNKSNLPPLLIEDIEPNHYINVFPPNMEFRLIYDNPEYLAQRKRESEREQAEWEEKRRIAKEKAELARQQAEQLRLKQIEDSERATLRFLKSKYESGDSII